MERGKEKEEWTSGPGYDNVRFIKSSGLWLSAINPSAIRLFSNDY